MKTVPGVDMSVVFGGNEEDIEACLASVLDGSPDHGVELRITVISNLGPCPLADRVEARFPGIRLVRNERPKGFAENHNAILAASDAEYVLVANDDLVFLPGSIRDAVAFLERGENRDVAVLAPRLLNPDGTLQPSTYRFPTVRRALLSVTGVRQWIPFGGALNRLAGLLGRGGGRSRFWAHDRTVDIDTFRGAYMLVRREAIRAVGPMEEVTLVGGEETEWHYRMREAGWRIVFHPAVQVVHRGSRTVRLDPGLRNEYVKGFLNFFRKHRSAPAYYAFAASAAVGLAARWALLRLSGRRADAEIAGIGARLCLDALRAGRAR